MGMSGFAFKLAPLCVQGGVYSWDVKGLCAARRDAPSMITADHSPHVNVKSGLFLCICALVHGCVGVLV